VGPVWGGGWLRSRLVRRHLLPLLAWAVLVGVLATVPAWAQRGGRRELEQRFVLRAVVAASFAEAYVDDLVERELEQAREFLSGPRVGEAEFRRAVAAFGYEAAVLLDDRGRLLRVAPPAPELLGQDLTGRYEHLRLATGGRVAVSAAVLSAARRRPVVAFAVPYTTPYGRRVFSGAYEIASTPLADYLGNAVPIESSAMYVVDRAGMVVASNRPVPDGLVRLDAQDPGLAATMARRSSGGYRSGGRDWFYASQAVEGTPWRLVLAVPAADLYLPVDGPGRWGPWLVVAAFALAGLLAAVMAIQHLEGRARRRRLERELSQQRELYERLLVGLSALGEGVLLDEEDRIVYANDAFCLLSGYSREELLRLPPGRVLPAAPDDQVGVFEGHLAHKSGHALPVEVASRVIGGAGAGQRLSVTRDITERKQWEAQRAALLAQVQALARTDALTGVANRRVWDEELPKEVARAARSGQPLCVAILDLDHFKRYNDTHGHQGGDRLLKEAAAAWRANIRVTDLLARYGGEEFALLAPACGLEDARILADRLRAVVPGGATVSIGVAAWDGQETAEELVARADSALYAAKEGGRDRYVIA
jgi:diguanylate cyclase (GGDEF)-like protein/PAS domain S-box-containing protein